MIIAGQSGMCRTCYFVDYKLQPCVLTNYKNV